MIKSFKDQRPKDSPNPLDKEAYSEYWKKMSFAKRLEELERLRAERYGYDLNNPPRMDKTFVRIINTKTGEERILRSKEIDEH